LKREAKSPFIFVSERGSPFTTAGFARLVERAGAAAEGERRLLYVAMTRAKDDLHLIVPQRFFTHGQSTQGDRHV
jgi:superfamily I DNA/RNA helicase